MKLTKIMMVIVLVLTASIVLTACGSSGSSGNNGGTGSTDSSNVLGSEVDKTKYEKATVDGILTSPTDEFFDKDVVIDAVITKICPAGCWFYIKDNTADASIELYVTKYQQRFLVPQGLEGTHVQVWGHVEADVKNNILAAERMEIVK
jgi:hypothetical protein